jgi:hypothetical protein
MERRLAERKAIRLKKYRWYGRVFERVREADSMRSEWAAIGLENVEDAKLAGDPSWFRHDP